MMTPTPATLKRLLFVGIWRFSSENLTLGEDIITRHKLMKPPKTANTMGKN